MEFKEVVIN